MDWTRGDLYHSLSVQMVDPTNLSDIRGEMGGVSGGKIDWDYYSETRGKAQLECAGDPWDGTSALRLVHTVSDWTGELLSEVLFTGHVTDREPGETTRYTVSSTLMALDNEAFGSGFTVGNNAKAMGVCEQILKASGRPYSLEGYDRIFSSGIRYGANDSRRHALSEICSLTDNRLTVGNDGTVIISKYSQPSLATPDWSEDTSDARTMVIGEPVITDDGLSIPTRVIVCAESKGSEMVAVAEVPKGSPYSAEARGYSVDMVVELHDAPSSMEELRQTARKRLETETVLDMRCSHSMMYRPLREGMVESLTHKGETRRWQVASATLDLKKWTWQLELKGGWQ